LFERFDESIVASQDMAGVKTDLDIGGSGHRDNILNLMVPEKIADIEKVKAVSIGRIRHYFNANHSFRDLAYLLQVTDDSVFQIVFSRRAIGKAVTMEHELFGLDLFSQYCGTARFVYTLSTGQTEGSKRAYFPRRDRGMNDFNSDPLISCPS
jgi:hypothetical protein